MKKVLSAIVVGLVIGLVSAPAFAIDVNKATAMELDNSDLMRVGPMVAKKIVDERDANGPYVDGNDLKMRVSGIGDRFLEQNADKLEFGTSTEAPAKTK